MSKPRPKFCVGEQVAVRSKISPQHDVDKTEVIAITYGDHGRFYSTADFSAQPSGWRYQTSHQTDDSKWYREDSLHKLPHEDRISWEDCVFNPSEVTA